MQSDISNYYAVIMAGGGGTRLWPLSRRSHPKQMMQLEAGRSLFEVAVDRLDGLFPPERIFVVTVREQAEALSNLCPEIPQQNFLIEPFPRGTAAVVGLAAVVLGRLQENATIAVLTADHFIENEPGFRNVLRAAYAVAQQDRLVTLGIPPVFPSTGFGYIERGIRLGQQDELDVYEVARFTEKPALDVAEEYLRGGAHYWNSGMFVWQAGVILNEFARQMPELHSVLMAIRELLQNPRWNDNITTLWDQIQPQTIDYGIMEHAERVAVLPATELGWNDVGAWDSLYDVLPTDAQGNIVRHPDHIGLDTQGTIVFSEGSPRLIVTIGVEDLIVIEAADALLICRRDMAQGVKDVVNRLKGEKREEYL